MGVTREGILSISGGRVSETHCYNFRAKRPRLHLEPTDVTGVSILTSDVTSCVYVTEWADSKSMNVVHTIHGPSQSSMCN